MTLVHVLFYHVIYAAPKNSTPNFFFHWSCKYQCTPSLYTHIPKWKQKFGTKFHAGNGCQSYMLVCKFGFAKNGWFHTCKTSSDIFFWLLIIQILLRSSSVCMYTCVALFLRSKTCTVSRVSSKSVACAYLDLKYMHLWHVKQTLRSFSKPL